VTLMAVIGAGLLAGMLHVYLGPDHLAALAVLSLKEPSRAWRQGLRWGLGHCGGVLFVAAVVFSFRSLFDVEVISKAGEALVGVSLIALGVWGFYRGRRQVSAPPAHGHGPAAYVVGVLHGAAGTSHLLGVVPSLALPSAALSGAYLAAFAVATTLGMGLFAGFLGLLGGRSEEAKARRAAWMVRTASAASVLVGLAWIALPAFGLRLP
jgi:hypothetical protein